MRSPGSGALVGRRCHRVSAVRAGLARPRSLSAVSALSGADTEVAVTWYWARQLPALNASVPRTRCQCVSGSAALLVQCDWGSCGTGCCFGRSAGCRRLLRAQAAGRGRREGKGVTDDSSSDKNITERGLGGGALQEEREAKAGREREAGRSRGRRSEAQARETSASRHCLAGNRCQRVLMPHPC